MTDSSHSPANTLLKRLDWRTFWPIWLLLILSILLDTVIPPLSRVGPDTQALILARYVAQFRAGHGLVFNPGERVLLIFSPLYMLLRGIIGVNLMQIIGLASGGVSLYSIGRRVNLPLVAALLVAIIFMIFHAPIQTNWSLVAGLSLLAFALALAQRWRFSGVVLAAAILCSPIAAIIGVILLLLAFDRGVGLRFLLSLLIPLVIAGIALVAYYGSGLWAGLLTLSPANTVIFFGLSLIVLLLFGLRGWLPQRKNPIVTACGAWVVLSLAIFSLLPGASAGQTGLLILGPLLLLMMIGLRNMRLLPIPALTYAVFIFAASVGSFTLLDSRITRTPIAAVNANSIQTIGMGLLQQAATVHLSTDQTLVLLDGQLQPEFKTLIERGDLRSALIRYAPDQLVLDGSSIAASDISGDLSLARLYDANLKRQYPVGDFITQSAQATFGPDIQMVGVAFDQSTLKPGGLLRGRLDWQFVHAADKAVTIRFYLIGAKGEITTTSDDYEQGTFRAGSASTYHVLLLPKDAPSGPVDVQVAVRVTDAEVARHSIATLMVAAP